MTRMKTTGKKYPLFAIASVKQSFSTVRYKLQERTRSFYFDGEAPADIVISIGGDGMLSFPEAYET